MNRHVHNVFMYCQRAVGNILYLYSICSLVITNYVTSSFDLLLPSDVDGNRGVIVQHNRATRAALYWIIPTAKRHGTDSSLFARACLTITAHQYCC